MFKFDDLTVAWRLYPLKRIIIIFQPNKYILYIDSICIVVGISIITNALKSYESTNRHNGGGGGGALILRS